MILTIDIGNTNIKYGLFEDTTLKASFRVSSSKTRTADEYGVTLCDLLKFQGYAPKDIDGIIMSSVIPSLNYTLSHMCSFFFKMEPLMVGPGIKTGLNIKVETPREVGADRIASTSPHKTSSASTWIPPSSTVARTSHTRPVTHA